MASALDGAAPMFPFNRGPYDREWLSTRQGVPTQVYRATRLVAQQRSGGSTCGARRCHDAVSAAQPVKEMPR